MGGFPANERTRARHFLIAQLLESVPSLQEAVSPDDERSLYGALRPEEIGEIRRSTASVAELLIRCARDGRGLRSTDRRLLRALGRQRAEWGVQVPAVTESFHRANRAAREVLRLAAPEFAEPVVAYDVAISLAGDLSDLVDDAIAEVGRGHAELGKRMDADDDGAWVTDVLEGGWAAREIIEFGSANGFKLTDPCLLGLAVPLTPRDALFIRERTYAACRRLPHAAIGRLSVTPYPHAAILVSSDWSLLDERETLGGMVARQGIVLLVDVAPVGELGIRYQGLRSQIALARSEARGPRLLTPDDLRLGRALAAIGLPAVFDFLLETIGPVLVRPDAEVLLDAVHALLSVTGGRNVQDYAYSTARKHLATFEKACGLRIVTDRTTVDTAIRLFRLHRPDLPKLGHPSWNGSSSRLLAMR